MALFDFSRRFPNPPPSTRHTVVSGHSFSPFPLMACTLTTLLGCTYLGLLTIGRVRSLRLGPSYLSFLMFPSSATSPSSCQPPFLGVPPTRIWTFSFPKNCSPSRRPPLQTNIPHRLSVNVTILLVCLCISPFGRCFCIRCGISHFPFPNMTPLRRGHRTLHSPPDIPLLGILRGSQPSLLV